MTSDKPRSKRRRPQTTPEPLTTSSGMPDWISLDRGDWCVIIRCSQCGASSSHGLPMLSSQVQQAVDEFAGRHRHAPPISDSSASADEPACPFCGSSDVAIRSWIPTEPKPLVVRCLNCKAEGPPAYPAEAAWERWRVRG